MVSVIIPNYNHAVYLPKRIESVLNQTYPDIENSCEVIAQYRQHPKVSQIVLNEQNSGSTFKQWKKGIELAKGEWIWIAESDDWCEPTFLEELLSPIADNPEIVIAFCQSLLVSPEDRIVYKTEAEQLYSIVNGEEFIKKKMLGANHIVNASMVIFKKNAFAQIPDDYARMKYCGDWLFWVHVCLQGKVFISGKYLNYFLRHDKNVASNAIVEGYDFLEGNQVFHFINKNLKVSALDKEAALKMRLDLYWYQQSLYVNKEVAQQVLASILALDPVVKPLLEMRKKRVSSNRLRSAISNYMHFFRK